MFLLKAAKVKVTRWFPGVLQAIVEEVKSKSTTVKNIAAGSDITSVRDVLAKEATKTLEGTRNKQIAATKEKTLDEIKKEMGMPLEHTPAQADQVATPEKPTDTAGALPPRTQPRRRVRQKMRSTPVVGGSLFDDPKSFAPEQEQPDVDTSKKGKKPQASQPFSGLSGQSAELVVGGEVFKIRVLPETIHRIRSGYSGEVLDDASVKFSQADVPIEHRLEGFIRTAGLQTITEDVTESSVHGSEHDSEW